MLGKRISINFAVVTALLLLGSTARADKFYVGPPNGFWSDAANWSDTADGPGGAGVPAAGEWTGFLHSDSVDRVVTLDVSTSIGQLVVYRYPGGTTTIVHPEGIDFTTAGTAIGQYSGGSNYQQSGGTHTTGSLLVGPSIGDYGTYSLSGGVIAATEALIGNSGYGTFIQSGGAFHVGTIQIARGTTLFGAGTYIMNGASASLVVEGNETISYRSHGFFLQSAGNHSVDGTLYVAAPGGGYGSYDISGGSLQIGGALAVGTGYGRGTFTQSGGTVTIGTTSSPQDLRVGLDSGTGYLELSGSPSVLTVTGSERLGFATFIQSAGYHSVGGTMLTGRLSNMSGGTLVVHGVQAFGGTFNQTGGFVNLTSPAVRHGPYSNYFLSGGTYQSPILQPYGFTWNGGTLNIGTLNLTGTMTVSLNSGNTLKLTGLTAPGSQIGTLDLTNNNMIIDYDGNPLGQIGDVRTFLQSGHLRTALSDPTHRLGYGDNADPLLHKSTFSGQTFPAGDFSQLLVMYTFGGDANLDGLVNLFDLTALATHWQQSNAFWTEGDFNYDGVVNSSDLGILAQSWPAGEAGLTQAVEDAGLPVTAIPEPVVGALGFAILALFRGRARPMRKRISPPRAPRTRRNAPVN